MTEASYTAWDDKQYVWPPPEGWYQAADQKWWPAGYGPPEAADAPAEPAASVDHAADLSAADSAAGSDADLETGNDEGGIGAGGIAAAGAAASATTMAFGDDVANGAKGALSGAKDSLSDLLPDAASTAAETTIISSDSVGIGDSVAGALDGASDSVGAMSDSVSGSIPDSISDAVGGEPTTEISAIDEKLSGLTQRVSELGDLSTPDLGDLPAPNLSTDGIGAAADASGLTDLGETATDLGDDIPSIKDLASPDMDLSDIPSPGGAPSIGDVADDVTQVVPTGMTGSLSDHLPPPPGAPDVSGLEAPDLDAPNLEAPNFDAPGFDAPDVDGPSADSSLFGAPTIGAPTVGAPSADGPGFDAPPPQGLGDVAAAPPAGGPGALPAPDQAPQYSAPGFGGQPDGPNAALQQEILSSNKGGGRSKTLLFVILGVLALAAIGAALFWQFGRSGDSTDDVAATATGPGSVNEPHPRSTGVVVFYPDGDTDQRWVIQVLEPAAVGTGDLAAGDADGNIYAVTRVQVRNESGSEGALLSDLRFNAVNAAGDLIDRSASPCPATGEDLDYNAAVGVGEEVVGTVCWTIPSADLDGLKLGLESEKVAGRVHISLQ